MPDMWPPVPQRYSRLQKYLAAADGPSLRLSFADLDALIDDGLPPAARSRLTPWWSNNPSHGHARAWVNAGWILQSLDIADETVILERGKRRAPSMNELRATIVLQRRHYRRMLRGRPSKEQVDWGWYTPHVTYVVHLPAQRLFKVGISRGLQKRLATLRRWEPGMVVVDTLTMPSRPWAVLLEAEILEVVDPWRVLGDPSNGGGYTEMWSETGPYVDLHETLLAMMARTSGPAAPPACGPPRD